ncbi:MAG: DUF4395 domain-containing protein [Rhodococcus sp. (in: high G+C Gram-positive bacteria)]|uniref:DUF4395 domain-containing protein n=1 Tax=Rhodococcus sp. TaxID=1831 RepID=UPI003BB627A3
MSVSVSSPGTVTHVDVRGPRFAAWVTTAVLVVVLAASTFSATAAGVVLAAQTVVFALGAALGPRRSPYGRLFAALVAPHLGAPTDTEPAAPLRFAQLVGFVFAAVGTVGFLSGAAVIGAVAAGFALFAALLNAAFGVCLGCRIHPLVTRLRPVSP